LFRLAIDRSFTLRGAGTVITGTVLSGVARVGDTIMISPSGKEARIRSLHAQNRAALEGRAGERCALNLAGEGLAKETIHRGDVALAPWLHAPTSRFDAMLRLLSTEAKPLRAWTPARLHIGAAETGAHLVPLSDDRLAPGDSGFAQLVLDRAIAAYAGDRFILRDPSAQRTIGGGRLVDPRPPARKRRTPERLAQLAALALEPPQDALAALLACAPHFVELAGFARDHCISLMQGEEIAARLGLARIEAGASAIVVDPHAMSSLATEVSAILAAFHEANPDLAGQGIERLRLQLQPRLPSPAFRALLTQFAREGRIVLQGAWARLPGHEARLTEADAARWTLIAPLLGGAERFRPPRTRDLANRFGFPETDVRRLLKTQSRRGLLDEIAHDHFFLRETTGEMVEILMRLSQDPSAEITAARFRDEVDNGRKVAIQILEFFDRHGVTLRRGDLRRINPHRLDLFSVESLMEKREAV
jgi:selenocysteine-specific elongation factor